MMSFHLPLEQTEVLIIGAGPVGLTAALELTRRGISYRLLDQADGPTSFSRALGIHPRTLEHFEQMGLADQVLSRGVFNYATNVYMGGERHLRLLTAAIEGESLIDGMFFISQVDIEAILRTQLASLGVTIEYRSALHDFQQDEQGVTATIHPSTGDPFHIRANWLIGCDGAHSTVRKQLRLPFEGSQEETWQVADAYLDWGLNADVLETHVFLANEGGVVAFPYPERGRWRLLDTSPDPTTPIEEIQTLKERLLNRIATASGIVPTIQELVWPSRFTIQQRKVPHMRVGRCFVAGDAAHCHSPAGGQGMNTGIQDAYNLAWKLALVCQDRAKTTILDSYSEEREPFAQGVLRGTLLLSQVIGLQDHTAIRLRNQVIQMVASRGGFQALPDAVVRQLSLALFQLNVAYSASSLIEEHWTPSFSMHTQQRDWTAGTRVPNVSLGGSSLGTGPRLFQVLKEGQGKQVLLIFIGPEEEQTILDHLCDVGHKVQQDYGESIVVQMVVPHPAIQKRLSWEGPVLLDGRNPLSSLRGRCQIERNGLYLLRPDGIVGYRSQPVQPEHVFAYLQKHFLASDDPHH